MIGHKHLCPGGCGADVAGHMFACRPCWYRLPRDLRTPILTTWWSKDFAAHSRAMTDAMHWYRDEADSRAGTGYTRRFA